MSRPTWRPSFYLISEKKGEGDDWQLGRPTVSPFCPSCREALLVFFRAA